MCTCVKAHAFGETKAVCRVTSLLSISVYAGCVERMTLAHGNNQSVFLSLLYLWFIVLK